MSIINQSSLIVSGHLCLAIEYKRKLFTHSCCIPHASFLFKMHDLPASSNIYFYFYHADSTVLAYVLSELNRRHNYGLDLFLLSVDEGITGYRDDSLETVKRNEIQVPPSHIVGTLPQFVWTFNCQYYSGCYSDI
jgi:hypothetical protein